MCVPNPQKRPRKQTSANGHVCFTPESGHVQCTSSCLLWAKSGHCLLSIANPIAPQPGGTEGRQKVLRPSCLTLATNLKGEADRCAQCLTSSTHRASITYRRTNH